MELVDRYLQAVKFWLPRQQKDDIVAELSEVSVRRSRTRSRNLAASSMLLKWNRFSSTAGLPWPWPGVTCRNGG